MRIEASGAAKRIGITEKGTAVYATFIGAPETEDAALRAAARARRRRARPGDVAVGGRDRTTPIRVASPSPHARDAAASPVVSHRGGYPTEARPCWERSISQ